MVPCDEQGTKGESVFLEEHDYSVFIELLKEVVDMYKIMVAVYL